MQNEKEIYHLFTASILLKGAISLAEIVAGIVVLFIPLHIFTSFAEFLTQHYNSQGFLLNHILTAIHMITTISGIYIAMFLISRGAIKLGLIFALLKNKLWAYPWSLGVLGLFVVYQTYEVLRLHSLGITAITIFDLIVMYFIWKEYQIVKKMNQNNTHEKVVRKM